MRLGHRLVTLFLGGLVPMGLLTVTVDAAAHAADPAPMHPRVAWRSHQHDVVETMAVPPGCGGACE